MLFLTSDEVTCFHRIAEPKCDPNWLATHSQVNTVMKRKILTFGIYAALITTGGFLFQDSASFCMLCRKMGISLGIAIPAALFIVYIEDYAMQFVNKEENQHKTPPNPGKQSD